MLDRVLLEQALSGPDWSHAASTLAAATLVAGDDEEHWRLSAIAGCARVLEQGTKGRDAAAQVRELVRLADGHVRVAASLLAQVPAILFADFAVTRHAEAGGRVLLELSTVHPVFDAVPDLKWALRTDPSLRRNAHPEHASAFLRRLSPHARFVSDGQKAALNAVMMMPAGATLVAALPTGWGKSALFQIGVRRWRESDPNACVVVIVPTVALAQDHARTLSSMPGLAGSRALVGGMKASERQRTLENFSAGGVPILLVSPEMALGGAYHALCEAATRRVRGDDGGRLAAVVVDEAHIVASWGRYFRPDFQRLPGMVQELRKREPSLRTLLLSATIDDDLRERLRADFAGMGPAEEVVVADPRDEFDLVWRHVNAGSERNRLVVQATDLIPRPAIVYTTTVDDAVTLHSMLRERGYDRIALFTGEIDDPAERQNVLDAWAQGAIDLVVATSAFGMGVDKANVRAVVHACLPEGADRLYQEIGRGGRDGHQALSLCLWTRGDASIAASLAIHGWMRPETSIHRWRAILQKARIDAGSSGSLRLRVPLDAAHDGLDRFTGQLNRQWNAALLTLLQRSGALRIVGEELTANGAEVWVAEVLNPSIVEHTPELEKTLTPFLSIGEAEATAARRRAVQLESALRNEEEGCFRSRLFDLVEPSGEPWPCGRCGVCVMMDESPRTRPNRHQFSSAWQTHPWMRACQLGEGAVVVTPEGPSLKANLGRLVARLARLGIEQFIATADMLDALEVCVCDENLDLGFTLQLGGDVRPARVPTAVLIGSGAPELETVRKHCMTLRAHFEAHWRELPLVFLLASDLSGVGAVLSQHLSSQAPMAESELTFRAANS